MVDGQRLLRLLSGIEADVGFLARFAGRDVDEIVGDDVLLAGIKYRSITAIEGCSKAAHHIAASEAWPVAESNADAVRSLETNGVITREVAGALAAATGFRNLLVHSYGDVDDRRVVAHLAELGDLRAFTEGVERWVRRQ